jgi:hypothetical protein
MFPGGGTPSMPFAGLGSFGDSLLTAAAAAGLDSTTRKRSYFERFDRHISNSEYNTFLLQT